MQLVQAPHFENWPRGEKVECVLQQRETSSCPNSAGFLPTLASFILNTLPVSLKGPGSFIHGRNPFLPSRLALRVGEG